MAAYVIAHLDVHDPETFARYRERVPEVVAQFGGRYLVRGGRAEALEGQWTVPRLVILEFESMARARAFYESPEYQEILPLRLSAARGTLAIVEGVGE